MWITERLVYSSILLTCCSILLLAKEANCSCRFEVSAINQPLISRSFGSKLIQLSNVKDIIVLHENETIQASCAAGFRPIQLRAEHSYYSERILETHNKVTLKFKCDSNQLYVSTNVDGGNRGDNTFDLVHDSAIECDNTTYSMYELRDELPNCDPYLSYALGAKLMPPIILAGICYDLDKLQLKYVSYKLKEPSALLEKTKENYPEGISGNSLRESLKSIEEFFQFPTESHIMRYIRSRAANNFWLHIANYELDNIVQSTKTYRSIFGEFDKFFNIIWWHNLRIGNWRRFMALLENHEPNVKYNIYTGTSGAVRVPQINKYQDEENLVIDFEFSQRPVPQFIWAYLEPTVDSSGADDFVAIAYNSPYFEYFERNSTILCHDICDEIGWLEPMQNSKAISTFGVFYCCRPEDVIGILDGFPLKTNKTASDEEQEAKIV